MKSILSIAFLSMSVSLAGCGTTCGGSTTPFSPIRPSVHDRLTDATAAQILVHNETGARVYGWRP